MIMELNMKKVFLLLIAILIGLSFCINIQSGVAFADSEIKIVFDSKNLYNTVVAELDDDYTYTRNDSEYTINIDLTEIQKIKKLELDGKDWTHNFNLDKTFISTKNVIIESKKITSAQNTITIYKDENVMLDSFFIDQDFSQTLTENGKYKIVLNSKDNHFEKTGEKVFEFEIRKNITEEDKSLIIYVIIIVLIGSTIGFASYMLHKKKEKRLIKY